MAKIQTYVEINGVDVTSYVYKWETTETFGGDIPEAQIVIGWGLLATLDPSNGMEVIIKRGPTTGQEYNVFKGQIDSLKKNKPYVTVYCKNMLIALVRKSVNTSFDANIGAEAGVASEIVNTLITEYGGLSTNSGATVVSTGTTVLMDKFVCRKTDIFERIETIKSIFDYQIYYNYDDDYVYFEPTGYTTNSNDLVVGTNVTGIPTWAEDNTQLINQIRVEGAEYLIETTETGQIGVTSGYTQTSINLTQSPVSTKVYCDAASPPTTLRIGGTLGATSTYQYYVDKENNQIIWNTAQYTPGASDYVSVDYTYPSPIPVVRKRDSSIAAYGESSTTKAFTDIQTVEDAIVRGELYLDTYAEPFLSTELKVPDIANDYRAGQKVRIVDVHNDKDEELVINTIVKKFPHQYDTLKCGNEEYSIAQYNAATLDRIKRLEEELSKNDDILISVTDSTRSFKPRRRYMEMQKQTLVATGWTWGDVRSYNTISGIGGVWGGSGTQFGSLSTVKMIQSNMTYQEYCYDTDFHDAVNSTATFDTVNQRIDFTSGQVWYSDVIDLGTVLSYVTVVLGSLTGSVTVEISSDGKSTWQTVTPGVRTAVNTSDGLGTYIRITESAAGTARIEPSDSDAAITMLMEE